MKAPDARDAGGSPTHPTEGMTAQSHGAVERIPLRARDGSVRAWALVDAEDAAWLNQWRWHVQTKSSQHRTMYAARSEHVAWDNAARKQRVKTVQMHVAIMGASHVDHINGNGLDNRRSNLRLANQSENGQNRRPNRQTRTGIRGVTKNEHGYAARAMIAGVSHWLGYHPTAEAAALAVRTFRSQHMPFSEDARAAT